MAATPTIDEQKLEQFMGAVRAGHGRGGDRAARGHRRQARPLQGDGRRRAGHARRSSPSAPAAASATCASGCASRRRAATSSTTRRARRSGCRPSRRWRSRDDDSPAFIPGAFQLVAAIVKDEPHITERFRTGEGFGWHEHDHDLFEGTERFFRPGYLANLVEAWLPSLDGVVEKLEAGARVADIGCGHGASTILMAQAYPASTFVGSDYHEGSIEAARRAAERAGVADRVHVRGRRRQGASAAARTTSSASSTRCTTWATRSAPRATCARSSPTTARGWSSSRSPATRVEDNLNPVGRVFYAASTMLCTPASLSQEVGLALGAQAGEQRLAEVLHEGGFSRVRRAAETPFNLVLEVRP